LALPVVELIPSTGIQALAIRSNPHEVVGLIPAWLRPMDLAQNCALGQCGISADLAGRIEGPNQCRSFQWKLTVNFEEINKFKTLTISLFYIWLIF
jgi:hypothetical protein